MANVTLPVGTSAIVSKKKMMVSSQPHLETENGNNLEVVFAEPKVKNFTVTFTPIQEGSGTPTPSNVRNIVGWSTIPVRFKTKTSETNKLGSQMLPFLLGGSSLNIDLDGTYYGGTVDLTNGTLTVNYKYLSYNSATVTVSRVDFIYLKSVGMKPVYVGTEHPDGYCNMIETISTRPKDRLACLFGSYESKKFYDNIYIYDINKTFPEITTTTQASEKLQQLNPIFVFEITPVTYQLTPQTIEAIRGYQILTTPATSISMDYYTH